MDTTKDSHIEDKINGDCKKPGCNEFGGIDLTAKPDPTDRPAPSELASNECKTCDGQGNIVADNSKDGVLVGDSFEINVDGVVVDTQCGFCQNGSVEYKSEKEIPECTDNKMCGNPCSLSGSTSGLGTSETACWAVKEGEIYTCYRDYASTDPDSRDGHNDPCCTGGCTASSPENAAIAGNWTDGGTGVYQCTVAEPCTREQASLCPAKLGF